MDVRTKLVKIEPLSEEAFAPYGEIIGTHTRNPDAKSGPSASWFSHFSSEGPVRVYAVQYQYEKPVTDWVIQRLEQHRNNTQTLIPLEPKPTVVAVAAPTPWSVQPDVNTLRAFLLDGKSGILLHKLTWHTRLLPTFFLVNPEPFSFVNLIETATLAELGNRTTTELSKYANLEELYGVNIKLKW